jgi:hypothetical protein
MERVNIDSLTVPHVESILKLSAEKGKLMGNYIFNNYYYYQYD